MLMLAIGALLHIGCACETLDFPDECSASVSSCGAGTECVCFLGCSCEASCAGVGCPHGQVCIAGLLGGHQCEAGCSTDGDCDVGSYCSGAFLGPGKCIAGCRSDADCAKGSACHAEDGRCYQLPCHDSSVCAPGYTCLRSAALFSAALGHTDAGSCAALSSGCDQSQDCTCLPTSYESLCTPHPDAGSSAPDASAETSADASSDAASD